MFLRKKTLTSMFSTMFFKTQNNVEAMHLTMLIAHLYPSAEYPYLPLFVVVCCLSHISEISTYFQWCLRSFQPYILCKYMILATCYHCNILMRWSSYCHMMIVIPSYYRICHHMIIIITLSFDDHHIMIWWSSYHQSPYPLSL